MEPVSLTTGAIASLIFSKALEKGGEQLVRQEAENYGIQ